METIKEKDTNFLSVIKKYYHSHFTINRLSRSTIDNYWSYYNSIDRFLISIDRKDIDIIEIDQSFIISLNLFLMGAGSATNAVRTIEKCQRACEYAVIYKVIESSKISHIKLKRDKVKDVIQLDKSELTLFMESDIKPDLCRVKDLYVFQALTGMSFGDLKSYQVIYDHAGEWIYNKRNKNQKEYWVPLHSEVKRIHEKYNGKLPRMQLNAYNPAIRECAKELGITKYLTSHTARKTFATRMYNDGWSVEVISDMMGITIFVLLKHYIKKSRRRLEMEVKSRNTG